MSPEPLGVLYVPIYLWDYVGNSAFKMLFTDTSFKEMCLPPLTDAFHCEFVSLGSPEKGAVHLPQLSQSLEAFSRGNQAQCFANPSTAGCCQEERVWWRICEDGEGRSGPQRLPYWPHS